MGVLASGCLWLLENICVLVFLLLDCLLNICHFPFHLWQRTSSSGSRVHEPADEEIGLEQSSGRKTVVVVGGNFAGLSALHELKHDASLRVVLVDQRDYFEYTPGILRLFCEPSLLPSMAKSIPQGSHEFVLGTVTSTNDDHVVVAGSAGTHKIAFDYLILATGADYRQPITASKAETSLVARAQIWQKEATKLRAARSVLILGGGAVGTELAAEILCYFSDKLVTIVDAQSHLVPLFPRQTVRHVENWFVSRGAQLLLGEGLEKWDERSCTTKSGRVIEADLVFVCFGLRCNSQCVAAGSMAGCLTERREVQVNEHLQVEGQPHVFATGDVMVHPSREIKQAYYAEMNGKMAALNVKRHSEGRPLLRYPQDLAGQSTMPLVYVVSLGRYDGSLGLNNLVINGFLAALLKWIIEWTKVAQMEGKHVGHFIWAVGDAVTFFISRTCLSPPVKGDE